jgi:hypothetical protein
MEGIFTKVYLALADESLPKSTWQRLYGEATPQRQAKADRLRFEKDKRLCLAAEGRQDDNEDGSVDSNPDNTNGMGYSTYSSSSRTTSSEDIPT